MHTGNLRKVGGSVMLAVPPAILDVLNLHPGSMVGMTVDGGRLIVEVRKARKYKLSDLLAQCDAHAEIGVEDREWIDSPAVGGELI